MKKMLLILVFLIPTLVIADGAPWGLRFKGNGYVDMTSIIGTGEIDEDFTWSVWINSTNEDDDPATGDKDIIMCTNQFSDNTFSVNHFLWFIGTGTADWPEDDMYLHDGHWEPTYQDITPDGNITSTSFDNDKWYHVALVFDKDYTGGDGTESGSNNIKIYVNGNQVLNYNTDTPAIGNITDHEVKFFLGADYDVLSGGGDEVNDYFEGGMDELTIWSAALSSTQIGDLAAMGDYGNSPGGAVGILPTSIPSSNLVGRYQFNDDDFSGTLSNTNYDNLVTGTISESEGTGPDINIEGDVYASRWSDYSLPIVLSSFDAEVNNGVVNLTWITESELNNAGFNLYRAENTDSDYEKINGVLIEGAVNSSTPNTYTFTDTEVKSNTKYFYKLEDVSTSGETHLHGPVTVATNMKETAASKFVLGAAYPNPFNPSTSINFMVAEQAQVKIDIYDMRGNLVNTLTDRDYSAGQYQVTWNAVDFSNNPVSAGIYIYHMTTNTGFSQSAKMILIK